MKDKLKISVIGTGHLGSIHSRLWSKCQYSAGLALYDIITEKSDKLAEELGCTGLRSEKDAIDFADAITVVVPTSVHFEIAKRALEAGKHCFIEKPITEKYAEAKELMRIASEKGLLIQVGHVERFNPAIEALSGTEINPRFVEAHRLGQFKPRSNDVSVIHDLMIHDIDLLLWMIKSPVASIDANGVAVLSVTPDIANARIKFENGAVANLTASRISASPMRKMRIFREGAYISIDFAKPDVDIFRIHEQGAEPLQGESPALMLGSIESGRIKKDIYYEKLKIPQRNAIAEEQNTFCRSILYGEPITVSASDAAEALRIAEEIVEKIG